MVRHATLARVAILKVLLSLGVKFLEFYSIERCLDLDLDSRYDLILGMVRLNALSHVLTGDLRP